MKTKNPSDLEPKGFNVIEMLNNSTKVENSFLNSNSLENKKALEEEKVRPNPTTKALNSEELHKGTKFSFKNPQRQRLYELFLSGKKLTTVSATVELRIPDFRSEVRYLKLEGVPISTYWVKSEYSKFKVYYLHAETIINQDIATTPINNSRHEKI